MRLQKGKKRRDMDEVMSDGSSNDAAGDVDVDVQMSGGDDEGSEHSKDSDEGSDDPSSNRKYLYEYTPQKGPKYTPSQLNRIARVEKASANLWSVVHKYGSATLPPLKDNEGKKSMDEWKIDAGSAWKDPSSAMKEIVNAREEMKRAWDDEDGSGAADGEEVHDEVDGGGVGATRGSNEWWRPILPETSSNNSSSTRCTISALGKDIVINSSNNTALSPQEEEQFQSVYMDWATEAFANELELLRKGELDKTSGGKSGGKKGKIGNINSNDGEDIVDLDPTHHSFIVAGKKKRNNSDEEEKAKAAAAAAEIDFQVLADMIQSGSYYLSDVEKRMLMNARKRAEEESDTEENNAGDGGTLHDRRRRELGFIS
jgi:hypothetical protein